MNIFLTASPPSSAGCEPTLKALVGITHTHGRIDAHTHQRKNDIAKFRHKPPIVPNNLHQHSLPVQVSQCCSDSLTGGAGVLDVSQLQATAALFHSIHAFLHTRLIKWWGQWLFIIRLLKSQLFLTSISCRYFKMSANITTNPITIKPTLILSLKSIVCSQSLIDLISLSLSSVVSKNTIKIPHSASCCCKYSLQQKIHINMQLKIIPDKCTVSCCLSNFSLTSQHPAF